MKFAFRVVRVLLIAFIGAFVFLPDLVPQRFGSAVGVAVLAVIIIAVVDGLHALKTMSGRGSK